MKEKVQLKKKREGRKNRERNMKLTLLTVKMSFSILAFISRKNLY